MVVMMQEKGKDPLLELWKKKKGGREVDLWRKKKGCGICDTCRREKGWGATLHLCPFA